MIQSSTPSSITFAKENDWYPIEGAVEGALVYLYGTEEPSSDHYAAHKAWEYGDKIGGFGRLLSESEANKVRCVGSGASFTGTVYNYATGEGPEIVGLAYAEEMGSWTESLTVTSMNSLRPVVTISKNLIKLVNEQ